MVDLVERLRAEVTRRSWDYEPPVELPDQIHARVRQRRRARQLTAGTLVVGAAAALVLLIAVLMPDGGDDEGSVVAEGDRRPTTTTTTREETTTTTTSASTTAPSGPTPSSAPTAQTTTTVRTEQPETTGGPAIGPDTPLSRSGIGPIRAGMTLRQAQEAAGVVITAFTPSGTCTQASIDGAGVSILAEGTGAPGADPMDSVIRVVSRSVEGRTVEGVAIGDPPGALEAAYGPPTRTYPGADGSTAYVFEAGGAAYGALTNPTEIAVLESGHPDWVGDVGSPTGCS